MTRTPWRRLSDWKRTVRLVDLADVDEFAQVHGLVRPEQRLRERGSTRLAELLATTRLVRVDASLATKLRDAGVWTYEVGYHRVSDGLMFAEETRFGREQRDVDMGLVVAELLGEDADDDEYDNVSADAVDALLRIFSEGLVTERAVLVAVAVPPLAEGSDHDDSDQELELEAYESLDPDELPDVSDSFVERVAAAFAATDDSPRVAVGPDLSPEARRSHQKKAAGVGFAALVAGVAGLVWAPMIAALVSPIIVLCLVVIALHEMVLRQDARDRGRR